jgi:hypothetical protein
VLVAVEKLSDPRDGPIYDTSLMGIRRSLIDPDSNAPSIRLIDHITGKERHGLENRLS